MSQRQQKKKTKANRKRKRVGKTKTLLQQKNDIIDVDAMEEKDQHERRQRKKISNGTSKDAPTETIVLDLNEASDDDDVDKVLFCGLLRHHECTLTTSFLNELFYHHIWKREALLMRYGLDQHIILHTACHQMKLPMTLISEDDYKNWVAELPIDSFKDEKNPVKFDTRTATCSFLSFDDFKKNEGHHTKVSFSKNPPSQFTDQQKLTFFGLCIFFEFTYYAQLLNKDVSMKELHTYRLVALSESCPDGEFYEALNTWYINLSQEECKTLLHSIFLTMHAQHSDHSRRKETRYMKTVTQLNYFQKDIKLMAHLVAIHDDVHNPKTPILATTISQAVPFLKRAQIVNFFEKTQKSERKALRYIYQLYIQKQNLNPLDLLKTYADKCSKKTIVDNSFIERPLKNLRELSNHLILHYRQDTNTEVVTMVYKEEKPKEKKGQPSFKRQVDRYFLPSTTQNEEDTMTREKAAELLHTTIPSQDLCFLCGDSRHHPMQCPKMPCTECLQTGHRPKDCPHAKSSRCDWCSFRGHDEASCVMKRYNIQESPKEPFMLFPEPYASPSSCYNCGSPHHIGLHCPRKPFQDRLQDMDRIAFVKDVRQYRY
mmetsp:Transcript_2587/g.3732  ORF Transcript_2587/g.3732 Transcript_2587/m.3732 type:complete len:599 (-) Transcript_2587:179-1975(-)